jgi:hypothetical protein
MDGYTSFFWSDIWNGRLLSSQFLELFSFAKDKHISVQSFISMSAIEDPDELFHLPLSTQAYAQFQQLNSIIANITLQAGNDVWSYIWNSGIFTSSKACLNQVGTRQVHAAFKWLWKSSCQPKQKFFFWLLLQDRLSTHDILKRRNMELQCYDCVLCHLGTEESLMHLFFFYPFSMSCWNTLGLAPLILDDLFQTLSAFRAHLRQPFFMEIIICMCWAIWSARNDNIFKGLQHSVASYKASFKRELAQVKLRVGNNLKTPLAQWIEHYV